MESFLLLLAAIVGHRALGIAAINRIEGSGLQGVWLVLACWSVEALAVWIVLLWCFGYATGPGGLIAGASWTTLPAWLLTYTRLCWATALVGLPAVGLTRALRREPRELVRRSSRVVDVAAQLGRRPMQRDRNLLRALKHRTMAVCPGNQAFQVELNVKEYVLPGLPPQWNGLSILHLSDTHFVGVPGRRYFEEVIELACGEQSDLVAFTGDLLDDVRCLRWLPATLGRLQAPLGCYYVLGNHDARLRWGADPVRRRLGRLGWTDVAGQVKAVSSRFHEAADGRGGASGLEIAGIELPWMGRLPIFAADNYRTKTISGDGEMTPAMSSARAGQAVPPTEASHGVSSAALGREGKRGTTKRTGVLPAPAPLQAPLRILLSHTPDWIPWARRAGVHLMLAGHCHGGQIRLPGWGPVYSPSLYGCRYAGGSFYEAPTLLHVSRGLGGTQPLRYRCRPEITKLILRA